MKNLLSIFLVFLFILSSGCSKDEEKTTETACDNSNLTYNSGVSSIINASCNASNCHNTGSPHGGFTSYSGLQPTFSNGSFNNRVLVSQDMPQGSATLSQDQLNKIKCWVDNGFPEN